MSNRNPFLETQEVSGVATAAAVLPRNASRRLLQIQNPTGGSWKFRFGAAPDATNGITLSAGASATYDVVVPLGDLFITSGSTFYLLHG